MRISESEDLGNVLVVDDDDDSREAVARALARSRYAVRAARNGREALIAVATSVPDVIVLDAMMPEMNGIEFLQVIRAYLKWATVPVILLTAYDKGEHIDRAREFQVKSIFLKANYQLSDLIACVSRVMTDPTADCNVPE
jgi:CheY-like chemotaxis protein